MESKVFYWSVGDNPRGRYLRISESGAGYVSGRPLVHTCNIARRWLSCHVACLGSGQLSAAAVLDVFSTPECT